MAIREWNYLPFRTLFPHSQAGSRGTPIKRTKGLDRLNLRRGWLGKTSPLIWHDQPPLPSNLSVAGDLILIVEKCLIFSAPGLKPLILAYFRASQK
jgi:hypothetical protein